MLFEGTYRSYLRGEYLDEREKTMDFRITYPFFVRSFESVSGLLLSEGWELDGLIVNKYFWRMLL